MSPARPHDVLSGCITWRMDVSYKPQGQADIKSGVVYRIYSNITPKKHRSEYCTLSQTLLFRTFPGVVKLRHPQSADSTAYSCNLSTERLPTHPT